ncbi:hypothetical protein Ancab_022473 [Ancistrocladus abbreviatus]
MSGNSGWFLVRNDEMVDYLEMVHLIGPCKSPAYCLSMTLLLHSQLVKDCHLVTFPDSFRIIRFEWIEFFYLSLQIFEAIRPIPLHAIEAIASPPSCSLDFSSDNPSLIFTMHISSTKVAFQHQRFDDLGHKGRVNSTELDGNFQVTGMPTIRPKAHCGLSFRDALKRGHIAPSPVNGIDLVLD